MPLNITYTTGYAGTGKSHTLIEQVKKLLATNLVVIAPTHKALHRLVSHLPLGTEVKTIHSLLGWIPTINENARRVEHIDSTHKLDKQIEEYDNIIIDEAGMMSEDMFFDIIGKIEDQLWDKQQEVDKIVNIHCFLDPYQLLPVKGQQIQTEPKATTNLTKQYRSESPDIVALYTKFVDYIKCTNTSDLTTPYSENVRPFDITKFKRGDRLLAYTNNAVGTWNQKIAKHLGITQYMGQAVQLGSMIDLVHCENIIKPTIDELLVWFESGILKLQNAQISKKFLKSSLLALITNKNIEFITDEDDKVYPVIIGIAKANIILKKAKEKAIKDKKYFKDVYALGRAYIMDYSFATTVHKSQGSEFDIVFIDKQDMLKSIRGNYYITYARLMYVAISRAKKIIYI